MNCSSAGATMYKSSALPLLAAAFLVAVALAAYHRFVVAPSQRIAVVDLVEIYRAKEEQLAKSGGGQAAFDLARQFSERLPVALSELPRECNCMVVLQNTIIGKPDGVLDLTALLKQKVMQ